MLSPYNLKKTNMKYVLIWYNINASLTFPLLVTFIKCASSVCDKREGLLFELFLHIGFYTIVITSAVPIQSVCPFGTR